MNPSCVTIGFFDGVHRGHQYILQQVVDRARSEHLRAVAVTFDRHPLQLFCPERAPQLICSLEEKVSMIRAMGIDEVLVLPFTAEIASIPAFDFMRDILVKQLHARHLFIGFDNRFGRKDKDRPEDFADYQRYGELLGIEVTGCKALTISECTISSSQIRQFLAEGNTAMASLCLGRDIE